MAGRPSTSATSFREVRLTPLSGYATIAIRWGGRSMPPPFFCWRRIMGRVVSLDTAAAHRRELRSAGKTVVFTNGLFDLLHAGHLDYLERASALGEVLIIGLNSDASARALKGPDHPIMPQEERGKLLSALNMVDMVVLFDATTATTLLNTLEPDVYVKGGDYSHKEWPEKETALAIGCRIELLPFVEGYSTSRLIETILARFGRNGPNV